MLCNVGVIVTELFAIERSESRLGLLYVAKPFAATCYTAAIVTVFLGAVRTWRYQKAMVNGRAISGGFEVTILGILFVLVRAAERPRASSSIILSRC